MADINTIRLPPPSDPRWKTLVCEGTSKSLKLLALKFMLARMAQQAKHDSSPGSIAKNAAELHDFFSKNPRMVAEDSATLFG